MRGIACLKKKDEEVPWSDDEVNSHCNRATKQMHSLSRKLVRSINHRNNCLPLNVDSLTGGSVVLLSEQ